MRRGPGLVYVLFLTCDVFGAMSLPEPIDTLRPRQNGCQFADDIFKRIYLNEKYCVLIQISQKVAPKVPVNDVPALAKMMACRRAGDTPLSEPIVD